MFRGILLLAAVLLISAGCNAVSFVPTMDIMTYGADGELVTIWGEHNFYTDTTVFGHPLTYLNGKFCIGGACGNNS